jgi:hypothetical protein
MKIDTRSLILIGLVLFVVWSGGKDQPSPEPQPEPEPVVIYDKEVVEAVIKADVVFDVLLHDELSEFDAPETETEAWEQIGDLYKKVNSAAYNPLNKLWMSELGNDPNRDDDDEEYSPKKFEKFLKSVAEGHRKASKL